MTRYDFKSDEEYQFYLWLLVARDNHLITSFAYEEKTFTIHEDIWFDKTIYMKTKKKHEQVRLFTNTTNHENIQYTPDFIFYLTAAGRMLWRDGIFAQSIQAQGEDNVNLVLVDVKGGYNPHGGDHRAFFLKQRLLWDSHHMFVHKVNPKPFFKRTFAPDEMRWMKNRRVPTLTKLGRHSMTCGEYIKKNEWKLQGEMFNAG